MHRLTGPTVAALALCMTMFVANGVSARDPDGRYARMLKGLARVQLLILDDWGITPLTAEGRRDLMEIIDDRHDRAAALARLLLRPFRAQPL